MLSSYPTCIGHPLYFLILTHLQLINHKSRILNSFSFHKSLLTLVYHFICALVVLLVHTFAMWLQTLPKNLIGLKSLIFVDSSILQIRTKKEEFKGLTNDSDSCNSLKKSRIYPFIKCQIFFYGKRMLKPSEPGALALL